MNIFQFWLLYCAYCITNHIAPPSYGDFLKGKKETYLDAGSNI